MTKLHLAEGLSLPLEIVTERSAFIGRTGQGKSYAAQKLAELLHAANAQFIVLDPVGIWWGLRLAANGKDPGLDIPVLGGLHGDVPLEAGAGKLIADLAVDRGLSMVLDVSGFEHDTDRNRFAADFAERFFHRKKSSPSAVLLLLEEGQEFVPQNPGPKETGMLHAFTRLAKIGRNFGIGVCTITQRPQEVNKKVLNLTELLFAFQLNGTHERKAVESWIEDKAIDEDIGAELPKLKPWNPHAWSPSWLGISKVVRILQRWTFDASSTPKAGAAAGTFRKLAPIDLEKLRTTMAATIEKAKAEDPKELRRQLAEQAKRIRELERQPATRVQTSATVQEKRVEVAVLKEGQLKRAEALLLRHHEAVKENLAAEHELERVRRDRWVASQEKVFAAIGELTVAIARLNGNGRPQMSQVLSRPSPRAATSSAIPDRKNVQGSAARPTPTSRGQDRKTPATAEGITKGQQRVLNALAELEAIGVDAPTRHQLGMVAGYNLTGGSGSQHVADLGAAGLVDIGAGVVKLTDAGRAEADPAGAPTTLTELHERVFAKVGAGHRRIAEHLVAIYPDSISRAELGALVGYNLTGGSGSQHVADLITLGAVRIPVKGKVAASELLFPALLENR